MEEDLQRLVEDFLTQKQILLVQVKKGILSKEQFLREAVFAMKRDFWNCRKMHLSFFIPRQEEAQTVRGVKGDSLPRGLPTVQIAERRFIRKIR